MLRLIIPYLVAAMVGIFSYNVLNQYPPISWFDADRREISKLNDQIDDYKIDIAENEILIGQLRLSIDTQNRELLAAQSVAKKLELLLKERNKTSARELANLREELKKRDPIIENCQEAIEYFIDEFE